MTRRAFGSVALLLSLLLAIQFSLSPSASAQPEPVFSINDVTVPAEGSGGTISATFTVSLSPPSSQEVSVQYSSSNGAALGGTSCDQGIDYLIANGTLTFSPNATTRTIGVTICGDALDESSETFFIDLFSAVGAGIADPRGQATIVDDDAPPTLSVGDVTVVEGNAGAVNAVVTVTLSAPSGQPVTARFATADATAAGGDACGPASSADYLTTSGTVSFNPGVTSRTVTIPVCSEAAVEPDETFFVDLSEPTNATIADGRGQATIVDDDGPPALSIDSPVVTEGNSGVSNAVFTVTLSRASDQPVSVQYATSDDTATSGAGCTSGVDYVSSVGALNFAPGVTSLTLAVEVCGDNRDEEDEAFFVDLSSPANTRIAVGRGRAEISDNDNSPVVRFRETPNHFNPDHRLLEGNTGTTDVTFKVILNAASGRVVTVRVATADGTARGGAACAQDGSVDYLRRDVTLSFNPGETEKTVTVPLCGETRAEPEETFSVSLLSATNAHITSNISFNRASVAIVDDDGPPTLSVIGTTAFEGRTIFDSDAPPITNVSARVTLSRAINQPVTFRYATQPRIFIGRPTLLPPIGRVPILIPPIFDRAATAGSQCGGSGSIVDYHEAQGELTIAPGSTSATIPLKLCADARDELDESFFVAISNAANAQILHRRATVTIRNDDPRTIRIESPRVTEGNTGTVDLTYTLSMSTPAVVPVIVRYEAQDRTAVGGTSCSPGVDFIRTSGEVTFAPGQTVKRVPVRVCGDTRAEPLEKVGMRFERVEGPVLAGGFTLRGTIVDNDGP